MTIEIILTKKADLKHHILIEGFPGIGLVGTIAAGYIVEKRQMQPIGYISSPDFPPMTTIHEGKPYFPARVYEDPKKDFCVLLSEFVVPATAVDPLSNAILGFAQKQGIKQIVSLAGMSSVKPEKELHVYGIASNDEMAGYMQGKTVDLIKEGVTTGVSGVLIAKCAVQNFPAVTLLTESKKGYPDPQAAAVLIEKLDALIGLKVDTKDLLREAKVIDKRLKKMVRQMKEVQTGYERAEEEAYPSMYE